MKIDLRDIITRAELQTWKEMSTMDDDASAYEIMMNRWQQELDVVTGKLSKEKVKRDAAYADKIVTTVKWAVGVLVACVVLWTGNLLITGVITSVNAARTLEYNKNIAAGLFPVGVRTGNSQIKGAPSGVTLEAMEIRDSSGHFAPKATLNYTLNLPVLEGNRVYAVSHEIINNGSVLNTGLFYTKPGESGLARFEKTFATPYSQQDFDWLKLSVRVVNAGSIPGGH